MFNVHLALCPQGRITLEPGDVISIQPQQSKLNYPLNCHKFILNNKTQNTLLNQLFAGDDVISLFAQLYGL